jgi:hypothetical protein
MSPKTILAAFVVLTSMALNPVAANADWHRHTGIEFRFHHPEDYRHWHSGYWNHGWHDGRLGWWWVAAGSWYFFTRPVYPYPSADVPPVVVEPTVTYVTPPPAPAPVVASSYWYYCRPSNSYYPYVSSCSESWMQVAANPGQP